MIGATLLMQEVARRGLMPAFLKFNPNHDELGRFAESDGGEADASNDEVPNIPDLGEEFDRSDLTQSQEELILTYNRSGPDSLTASQARQLSRLIDRQPPLARNVIAYRGVSDEDIRTNGQRWTTDNFTSVSFDRSIAENYGDRVVQVRILKGTRVFDYMAHGLWGQAELILNRGTKMTAISHGRWAAGKELSLDSALSLKYSEDQPREPAGSPEGGQFTSGDSGGGVGGLMAGAPVSGTGAAAWRKRMQQAYTNDPKFRALADSITLFTQGEYNSIRALSEHAITGTFPKPWDESSVPSWVDRTMSGNPLANYKNYFEGQDVANTSTATWGEGARAINEAIATSQPLDQPIYRGMYGREMARSAMALKAGDPFDIVGASSFTADEALARKFSRGVASGQHGGGLGGGVPSIIVEVQAGAHGLKVAALSPWKQSEVISSGKFEVVSAAKTTQEVYSPGGYYYDITEIRVIVRQTGTWSNK